MAAATIAQVQQLLDAGRRAEAAQTLALAARAGDSEALAELAQWLIAGNIIPRDLGFARDLLSKAAALGHDSSALLHAYFLFSGTGGPPNWEGAVEGLRMLAHRLDTAATQLRHLKPMAIDEHGYPIDAPAAEQLSANPFVAVSRGFLTPEECGYLIAAGTPLLQPSLVVDPASGRMVPHPVRVSDGAHFGVHSEDLVIAAINRRIARLSGTQYDQGEPLQLLRYGIGGEYREHMDALAPGQNQRIITVLIYLNEDYDGGETHFPRIGLSFKGRRGDALVFHNAKDDDRPDPLTLHAGAHVTAGTKYLATRWIRRARFAFPPPRPLLDKMPW